MFVSHGLLSVSLALFGNFLITIFKFAGFLLSGSSVLFSESIHSLADTLNQALLLVGIQRSRRKADAEYSYGYGQERFFWALISACGIFFLGAGVTVYHGVEALRQPGSTEINWVTFAILIASFVIESLTLLMAVRELRRAQPKVSFAEALKNGDPTTIAVLYEDSVAVLGVVVALISILLMQFTGEAYWDAFGSILIGLMLAVVAVILIKKNRSFLLKKSIPEEEKEQIVELLLAEPLIEKVIEFKSTVLDIGVYHVQCEIEFNGTYLLKEIQEDLREDFDEIGGDYEEFKKFATHLIDRVPRLIGQRINEIEARIKFALPQVRHIDIEIN